MSNPFDDLPAPKLAVAAAVAEAAPPPPPPPSAKRDREDLEEEEEAAPPPPSPKKRPRAAEEQQSDDADPVATALARLTPHLRSASRVAKAGPLLRQLLDGGGGDKAAALDPRRHARAAFEAVAAAFADPSLFLAAAPAVRVEYARIARSAQRAGPALGWGGEGEGEGGGGDAAAAGAFVGECAAAWALLRLELLSAEDAFALSRALAKVKALVDALPAWEEGDEVEEKEEEGEDGQQGAAAATAPAATTKAAAGGGEAGAAKKGAAAAAAAAAAPPPPPPSPPPPLGWPVRPAAVLLLRRRAALDCALCARDHCHARPWAATAVEMALEHCAARSDRFAPGRQRSEAKGLADWVAAKRTARRVGGGAGGGGAGSGAAAKDDRGAFERARAQFAAAGNVSARGSVGNRGGASTPWLG